MGTYLRVRGALGLESDLHSLGADDKVGRKLQDLALGPSGAAVRRRQGAARSPAPAAAPPSGDLP
jgi:hypothetical protein